MSLRIDILTLFPEMVRSAVDHSIVKRAQSAGLVAIAAWDLRDWAHDKRRTVDDAPYGGGAGMVIKPEPVFEAVESLKSPASRVVLLTPQGKRFDQAGANRLAAAESHLILICGHYEGFDERIREHLADEEISLGDFVLTGGEIAALAVADSVVRLLPGALGNSMSPSTESFEDDLLEYPQYTRPAEYRGWPIPEVLVSGHHGDVEKWRRAQREARTKLRRPDLWERHCAAAAAAERAKPKTRDNASAPKNDRRPREESEEG